MLVNKYNNQPNNPWSLFLFQNNYPTLVFYHVTYAYVGSPRLIIAFLHDEEAWKIWNEIKSTIVEWLYLIMATSNFKTNNNKK
jgi:hypothetical protein